MGKLVLAQPCSGGTTSVPCSRFKKQKRKKFEVRVSSANQESFKVWSTIVGASRPAPGPHSPPSGAAPAVPRLRSTHQPHPTSTPTPPQISAPFLSPFACGRLPLVPMGGVIKIVSGGQTGADRAALDWALACGMNHGGWCPLGRRSESGPIPAA